MYSKPDLSMALLTKFVGDAPIAKEDLPDIFAQLGLIPTEVEFIAKQVNVNNARQWFALFQEKTKGNKISVETQLPTMSLDFAQFNFDPRLLGEQYFNFPSDHPAIHGAVQPVLSKIKHRWSKSSNAQGLSFLNHADMADLEILRKQLENEFTFTGGEFKPVGNTCTKLARGLLKRDQENNLGTTWMRDAHQRLIFMVKLDALIQRRDALKGFPKGGSAFILQTAKGVLNPDEPMNAVAVKEIKGMLRKHSMTKDMEAVFNPEWMMIVDIGSASRKVLDHFDVKKHLLIVDLKINLEKRKISFTPSGCVQQLMKEGDADV